MVSEKEVAQVISESVNHGINPDEFVSHISSDHKYLQGEVFNQIIKPLICEYAQKVESGDYDQRNKRAVEQSKEIADAMNWSY